jgi:LysM repeat protein
MCGHDLRTQGRRKQRVAWVDLLLVLAVLLVLGVWWQIARQPRNEQSDTQVAAILPTNIPILTTTEPTTATVEAVVETPTPVPTAAANGVIRHRVRSGETLLSIAGIYGVSVDDIQAANGMQDVLIRAGDELIIPVGAGGQTDEGGAATTGAGTVASAFEYTVEPGDTIVSIGARFGSTSDAIIAANGLSQSDFIRPGDVLMIPVSQVPAEVLASTGQAAPAEGVDGGGRTYVEPRLIGPPQQAAVATAEAVLLRWISVDVLAPNEWYVLLIYPVSGAARTIPSIWTKATSYRLDPALAPTGGENAIYAWRVSVVRVRPGVNNQFALEAASPPSELRSFTWQ